MATTPPPPPNNAPLDNLNDQQSALFDMTEQYKKLNKEAGIYTFETRAAVSRTTELNGLIKDTKDIITDIGVAYVKQSKVDALAIKLRREITQLTQQQANILKNQTPSQTAQLKLLQDSQVLQKKLTDDLTLANIRESEAQRKQTIAFQNLHNFQQSGIQNLLTQNRLQNIANGRTAEFTDRERKRLQIEQQLTAEQQRSAKISSSSYITNKELTDQQLKSAQVTLHTLESQAQAIEQGNKKLQQGNFLKEILKRIPGLSAFADLPMHAEKFGLALSGALVVITGIVVAIKEIIASVFKVDNQVTDMAKNLGISKTAAFDIRDSFADLAKSSTRVGDDWSGMFITADNLVGAMNELNEALGTSVVFSSEQLKDQIEMTKVMGISVESATKLVQLGELNGESATQTRKNIESQVIALSKETGIRLNARKIIEQVAKVEGQLAVQYKNNPSLIAQAVVQAQRFGLSLEQAKKSSDSLLDFETSIDSQLEAQLLTDKALNFEHARELALMGDSAGAAADLMQQIGGINEYQKLNVIQQQSLAKSIGMSADELSNSLRYQQLLTNLTGDQRKNLDQTLAKYKGTVEYSSKLKELQAATNADELDRNLQQISIQQQFEASMSKIRDVLASMVTPGFIDALRSLANGFTQSLPIIMGVLKFATKLLVGLEDIGIATANVFGAGMKYPTFVDDGLISPQGNVVISTPKGAIVPDKSDSIVTTTNPGGLLGGGGDNSGVLNAIAAKLDKLNDLIAQGGKVYLDSKPVGTVQGMALSSYA